MGVRVLLIDCHVHSMGNETANDVIKAMEKADVDKAIIFAPYPWGAGEDPKPTTYMQFSCMHVTNALQRKCTKFISELSAEAPDRISLLHG